MAIDAHIDPEVTSQANITEVIQSQQPPLEDVPKPPTNDATHFLPIDPSA